MAAETVAWAARLEVDFPSQGAGGAAPDRTAQLGWILYHVVGLQTQAQMDAVVRSVGIRNARHILLLHENDILEPLPAATTQMSKSRLRALKKFLHDQHDLDPDAELELHPFTQDKCEEIQMELCKPKSTITDSTTSNSSGTNKDKIQRFSGKQEDWAVAKHLFLAHVRQIKNKQGIPLYYVIRDPISDQSLDHDVNGGEIRRKMFEAPDHGQTYDEDMFKVLQIMKEWTAGGHAEKYLDQTNDACQAWNKIIAVYDGEDAIEERVEQAQNTINNSHWKKNTYTFSFDTYCSRHIRANMILKQYGRESKPRTQVMAFLKGIKTENSPHAYEMINVKSTIRNNNAAMNDLMEAVSLAKDMVQFFEIKPVTKDNRRIGLTGRSGRYGGRGYHHRGGRYGGRGRRSGYRGRGGYGGRGRHYGNSYGNQDSNGYGEQQNQDQQNSNYIPQRVIDAARNEGSQYVAMLFRGRDAFENNDTDTRQQGRTRQTNQEDTANDSETDDFPSASEQFGARGRRKRRKHNISSVGAVTTSGRSIGQTTTRYQEPSDFDLQNRADIDT